MQRYRVVLVGVGVASSDCVKISHLKCSNFRHLSIKCDFCDPSSCLHLKLAELSENKVGMLRIASLNWWSVDACKSGGLICSYRSRNSPRLATIRTFC